MPGGFKFPGIFHNNTIMKQKKAFKKIHLVQIPDKHKKDILKIVTDSINEISKILEVYNNDLEIVVGPGYENKKKYEGVYGLAHTNFNFIEINIDFNFKDLKSVFEISLPATIFHEYSHIATKHSGNKLIDRLVNEGIACYIEKKFFPRKIFYIAKMKNEDKFYKEALEIAYKKLSNEEKMKWFVGKNENRPEYIGYRIGYLLIKKYMDKFPKTKLGELIMTDPKKIHKCL